ncbi:MAG: DEAD/DEAH box helicase [Acidimicrobiales bacterium]
MTLTDRPGAPAMPEGFHPAVRAWFTTRFPDGPTAPQSAAWPLIATGRDVLVASPTGTGKTLTGFLMAIDAACHRSNRSGDDALPSGGPRPGVVYVSPLRALAVDVHENLGIPLDGIRRAAERLGTPVPDLSVAVRTGDTPPSARAAMRRSPPDLLVTTPESLYLLLTAAASREMLHGVHTVIVDEVHTLARDKRGAHLALTLERLAHVVESRGGHLQRIGLSATQRPLSVMADLLSGAGGRPRPAVVDCGHMRDVDVAIELPSTDLEAVTSHRQFGEVLDGIADHIRGHRTTLVFVNTRKLAERVAHQLDERLADDARPDPDPDRADGPVVAAHHGSLSADRRRLVETRLRAGELRALVATASLELGIDVGPVELVCQIGSPRAIATFLQRVGRANHQVHGTPVGRLYPLTRDELVECAALLAAVRSGRLDALEPVVAPLDVLAQQLVAEVAAAGEWDEDGLFDLVRRAAPYAGMDRSSFDEVVDLVSRGIATGRGRRGAHLHRDAVHGQLRARRGARLAALTNGGAIPDTGDYRVVLDPDGVTLGSVHEDFAVEANIGDVFLLGTHSWRVRQVEVGTVRVTDAGDASPSVPFWLGEAPARTPELSAEVGDLRAAVESALVDPTGATGDPGDPGNPTGDPGNPTGDPGNPTGDPGTGGLHAARRVVRDRCGLDGAAADQVVTYLAQAWAALGALPTQRRLVVERFFDDTEGTQLVIHSPYGGRINRALGLALRKRLCVNFDFELQAAADDDTVVLSLGPQHSFPLEQVFSMLSSRSAGDVLTQAVLFHPMLRARWRWSCTVALVVPRSRGGRRRPIHLQRMDADDVMAAAWPALAACQENAPPGPVTVTDHVLVAQTVRDCLTDPLDVAGLTTLLADVEAKRVELRLVESVEPSVLAHGILSGRPTTFLDGAPLEERRSRAVALRRGPGQDRGAVSVPLDQLAPLDGPAAAAVLAGVHPRPRAPDELHDLLLSLVLCRPVPAWRAWFDMLAADGRAAVVEGCWAATERLEQAEALDDDDSAVAECLGGHLEVAGPVTEADLIGDGCLVPGSGANGSGANGSGATGSGATGEGSPAGLRGAPVSRTRVRTGLARLEAAGAAIRLPDGRWCARHLLVRLHAASRARRRERVEAASIVDFVRFLTHWQHAAPGTRLHGRSGLLAVIEQLAGVEAAAGDWERHILPARIDGYDPRWLDELCLAGEVGWGRLTPRVEAERRATTSERRGSTVPSPATPLSLMPRPDLGWLLAAVRDGETAPEPVAGSSADVLAALRSHGASFRSELGPLSGRLPEEVDQGLWDLVARGVATADAFSAVRALLNGRRSVRAVSGRRFRRPISGPGARGAPLGAAGAGEGRWALLPEPEVPDGGGADREGAGRDELAEAVAWQMLQRWGVVAWELWGRESFGLPWRDVVRALRRFEARGVALGGRFVAGLSGEQYALPGALACLTRVRSSTPDGSEVVVAASDPLNVTGTVVPGRRVPAVRHRTVALLDGVVLDGVAGVGVAGVGVAGVEVAGVDVAGVGPPR